MKLGLKTASQQTTPLVNIARHALFNNAHDFLHEDATLVAVKRTLTFVSHRG